MPRLLMARGKTITAVRKEEPATKKSAAKKAALKKAAKKSAASRTPRTRLVPLLEMRNVCVFRGGREVLHALDLTIAQGEHVAILGSERLRQKHADQNNHAGTVPAL